MSRPIYALLRRLSPPDDPSSDAALLHRYARQQDQTAFELLVWRHGGLVLGVCRRVLRDDHLAEDAFQATFLILARKAGSVRGSHNGALAGWLHQVARRVCLRALKRNPVPLEPGSESGTLDPDPLLSAELRTVLDEEIARLPEKQRLAVLLCHLQGRTTDDAAKLFGIPRGTVLSRLDAARKRLQAALTRRGLAVPGVLFAGGLVAPDLPAEVCRRAAAFAFEMSPNLASVPTQLAHEVMHMTTRKAVLGVAAVLVLTAGVGTGVGLVMAQGGKTPTTKVADKPAEQKAEPAKAEQKPADAAELQAKLRARRLEELEVSQHRVSRQIEQLEERRLKAVADAASEVDPGTLQAKLGEIDKGILAYEDALAAKPNEITAHENRIKEYKAGRFTDGEKAIQEEVTRTVDVSTQEARTLYNQRRRDVDESRKRSEQESELVKQMEKLLEAAKADVATAREAAKARADKSVRERWVQEAEARLKASRNDQEQTAKELKSLRVKRVDLVVRIQRAKTSQSAQQLIDDEIQVLREIRKQVLRDRLMLEMGLDERK